ncbi:MAG: DUF4235 domain-containing protein [Propionibacteriaceae bacterium]|jgi:hypothetical protein|nr:DUF4235 domain-containing protein [Propionibacteriaceae bacterium]
MDKVIVNKMYTAVANVLFATVGEFLIHRGWEAVTHTAPPDIKDPDTSVKRLATWLALSAATAAAASVIASRTTLKK